MGRNQRWRQLRKSDRTWFAPAVPLIGGILAGGALGLAAYTVFPAAPMGAFWAAVFGFIALALPLAAIQKGTERLTRDTRALINLRPYVNGLLNHDRWAMDAVFAEHILSMVDEGRERILELGSGQSTLLIAQRLEDRGRGHVVAVDHLEEFADSTRSRIEEKGLTHRATVLHAPVMEQSVEGEMRPWYDWKVIDSALTNPVDLLIVDGPPRHLGPDARWPAVPLLRDRLAPGAAILMDDGDRSDERRAAFDWHRRLGGGIRYLPGPKGGWLLRLAAGP